jgi:hypothetical protein
MHQFATEAATMAYNLATAALATGVKKSTILRAIKAGRLSATRDEIGWTIEVAELHRVFAPLPAAATAEQSRLQRDATTDELVRLLREQLPDMRVIAVGSDAGREGARDRVGDANGAPNRARWRAGSERRLASREGKADVFPSRRENRANRKAAGRDAGKRQRLKRR